MLANHPQVHWMYQGKGKIHFFLSLITNCTESYLMIIGHCMTYMCILLDMYPINSKSYHRDICSLLHYLQQPGNGTSLDVY